MLIIIKLMSNTWCLVTSKIFYSQSTNLINHFQEIELYLSNIKYVSNISYGNRKKSICR